MQMEMDVMLNRPIRFHARAQDQMMIHPAQPAFKAKRKGFITKTRRR
jgi:hypothetical protein